MKSTILILFFIFMFSFVISGQDKSDKNISFPKTFTYTNTGNVLERKTSYVDWKNTYFSNAVKDIFWLTDVPYGMSLAVENAGEYEVKVNANPKKTVVKDLLNEIIKYDSRYQWKETNGVVNILPKNDYPIMDVRIAEFKIETLFPLMPYPDSITKDTKFPTLNELEKKLVETKEFQDYIKERNLLVTTPNADKHGFIFIGFIGKPHQTKISIDLKKATVREILNEIARQRGFGWTYQEFSVIEDGKLYNIFRLDI